MHAGLDQNRNGGHRGSSTRGQLEDALREAGAQGGDVVPDQRPFQTSGTVLMVADDPVQVVRDAAGTMATAADYDDAARVRQSRGPSAGS